MCARHKASLKIPDGFYCFTVFMIVPFVPKYAYIAHSFLSVCFDTFSVIRHLTDEFCTQKNEYPIGSHVSSKCISENLQSLNISHSFIQSRFNFVLFYI